VQICAVIGSPGPAQHLHFLVASRRTRVSGNVRGKMSRGNVCSQGQCPFSGVLAWSTEIVDGRPRVLHLRRSSASWLDAHSSLHISHCDEEIVN